MVSLTSIFSGIDNFKCWAFGANLLQVSQSCLLSFKKVSFLFYYLFYVLFWSAGRVFSFPAERNVNEAFSVKLF